ncbi:MAG TPA: hypothetical protein PKC87_06090 [Candidatus Absconditabacterales bacterium]|nr:hypothetical protein [Candidatus Absconditabacterales bacterium]
MLLKHIIISCLVIISPIFPPVIIPITYTLMGIRLVQGAGPIAMSIGTVIPAALSSIAIWLLYGYMHRWILKFKEKRDNKDWISRWESKFATYIENRKGLNKFNKKITNYLEAKNSKRVLFLLTIVAIDSAIPDIAVIGIVRKRLPFVLFIIAATIGKATVYLPVIRGAKWILNVFGN